MDEHDEDDEVQRPGVPSEGVRIIGAEEAAEAIERGDVARRRGEGQPRFGDRPQSAQAEGARPALRFPLGSSSDPSDIQRSAVAPVSADPVELPHWTEPPTGEVPAVLRGDDADDDDLEAWDSVGSSPRWRDSSSQHEAHDFSDLADLRGDDTQIGALDETDRPRSEDWFSFADLEPQAGRSVFAEAAADDDPAVEMWGESETLDPTPPPRPAPRRSTRYAQPERGVPGVPGVPVAGGGDRDIGQAVIVGSVIAAIALFAFSQGPGWSMLVVLPCIGVAAVELFSALRQAGYQPVTLAGLASVISLVIAAYYRGETAIPAVLVLTLMVCFLWYLFEAGGENPTLNIGATMLAVCWVGVFGSFAAVMLSVRPHGIGLLLGAIVGTVGYDVGGLFVGRNAGRQPLSAASPNKTVEGLIGGCVIAFVACLVLGTRMAPFDGFANGAKLGLVVMIAAPFGDLCQSLIKRDLGIKDMGSLLPGHGGFLDRFDAMLFVLPAVWYLARFSDFFQ